MFDLAVQGQSTLVAIVGQQRRQVVDLAEPRLTWQDWKPISTCTAFKNTQTSDIRLRQPVFLLTIVIFLQTAQTIPYDRIEEFNVDSKAEYSALSSTRYT